MQIVIDIPDNRVEEHFPKGWAVGVNIYRDWDGNFTKVTVPPHIPVNFKILSDHGRLIDADDIDNHIIGHVDTRSCPTIIEAAKESEG